MISKKQNGIQYVIVKLNNSVNILNINIPNVCLVRAELYFVLSIKRSYLSSRISTKHKSVDFTYFS